ncbi:MAG: ABC transporter transmembrane domain-containing protein, partial [Arcanobacterium sp.]|nr:ABC transporter transmembrane domain-containing protein [Arcanobacterium sp.]
MSESTTKAFIKGPEPKKWPKLFEVGHSGAANPERLVRSIIWQRRGLFAITTTVEILAFFGVLLIPFVIGEILDSGIEQGLSLKLLPGFLGLAGLIILRSAIGTSDLLRITLWSHTKITLGKQIVRKTFGVRGIGKEKIPSGELVSAFNSDLDRIADLVTQLPGIIAAMLSLSVAGVLIFNISAKLGFLIMIGMPVVLLILMLLMKPLQARFSDYRDARGELATLTTDAVVGLRILRGVGGEAVYNESYKGKSEKVRDAGIRAARVQSLVSALNAGVPAVFSAVVVSFAFLEFYKEAITAGQLLQIYGYTAFLSAPMNMSFFFLFSLADARVGITRVQKMLGVTPLNTDDNARIKKAAEQYEELSWDTADLIDVRSGAVLEAGKQTAIVAQSPVAAASLAKRFARMDD